MQTIQVYLFFTWINFDLFIQFTFLQNYQRHLILRSIGMEDFAMLGDADSLALDQVRDAEDQFSMEPTPTPAKRGRKRKIVEDPVCSKLYITNRIKTHVLIIALKNNKGQLTSYPKSQNKKNIVPMYTICFEI